MAFLMACMVKPISSRGAAIGGGGGDGDLALTGGCGGFLSALPIILFQIGGGVTEEEYLLGAGSGGGSISSSSLAGGDV